jgi:hypothetical protein
MVQLKHLSISRVYLLFVTQHLCPPPPRLTLQAACSWLRCSPAGKHRTGGRPDSAPAVLSWAFALSRSVAQLPHCNHHLQRLWQGLLAERTGEPDRVCRGVVHAGVRACVREMHA